MLSKYLTHSNNQKDYNNKITNISSIKNNNTIINKNNYSIIHTNDRSLGNYLQNPISNDSVLNINLFENELSDSNQRINLTNINTISELAKFNNYKNIDSQTKNSSNYLETEESKYNNALNINCNLNKQLLINNFNEINLNNENGYKRIDLNRLNVNNKFMLNFLETDNEINNTSSESGLPEISKFAKIKDFYSRNNLSKINDISASLINQTEGDLNQNSNNIEKNTSLDKQKYRSILLPMTNKNINSKKMQFSYNLNNFTQTPTKLFHIPEFKKVINKTEDSINIPNENNKPNRSLIESPNRNYLSKHHHISPNLNFINSIKNRINQKSIKTSDTPTNISNDNDYKKKIHPKIRIISRNVEERDHSETINDKHKHDKITEINNSYKNGVTPISICNKTDQTKNLYTKETEKLNMDYLDQIKNSKVQDTESYNNNDENIYVNDKYNNHNSLKNQSMIKVYKSNKEASNVVEEFNKLDRKIETQKTTDFISNENLNRSCNCKKNLQDNQNHNERDQIEDEKKENYIPYSRNDEDREITFNVSKDSNKNFTDNGSVTSKEAIFDENDSNIAFINKSSKNSSHKDYVISDSNDVEIEISGKLISMDYSNSTLKKKASTNKSFSQKDDKINYLNSKKRESKNSLKLFLANQVSNHIDSKVTILDISGLKNSNSNAQATIKDSHKEFLKANLNKNHCQDDKIEIENLIKNLDKKIDSRNKTIKNCNNFQK